MTTRAAVVRADRSVAHTAAYAGLVAFTVMLYLRPNELLPIGTFQIVKIVAILMLIAFVMEQLPRGRISIMPIEFKYVLWLAALMLIGLPLSIAPATAFESFTENFAKVALTFMVMINVGTTYQRLRRLVAACTVCGTIIAWGSTVDYLRGVQVEGRTEGWVGGIFGNPNDLALALNILIPLAIGLALTSRSPGARLGHIACVGILLTAVMVTFSRAGFLTLVAIALFIALRLGRRSGKIRSGVVAAAIIAMLFAPTGYLDRSFTFFSGSDISAVESANIRWDQIWRAFEVMGANPIRWVFGIGVDTYVELSTWQRVHHNAYLQVFNEVGLPGLIVYLLLLVTTLRAMGRVAVAATADGDRDGFIMARTIQGALIAYAVGSFFASVAYLWYLYYPAGFAVCLRLMREGEATPVVETGRPAPQPLTTRPLVR